jgi:hypothetical protein
MLMMPPAAKTMKLACNMLRAKVRLLFKHGCGRRPGHLPKDNHKDHGVGHVSNPDRPPLPRSPVDHAQHKEAKDARADHGDIETYRHGVDGSPPVKEEERHHLVSVNDDSGYELWPCQSAVQEGVLQTSILTGKKDGRRTSTLVVGSGLQ